MEPSLRPCRPDPSRPLLQGFISHYVPSSLPGSPLPWAYRTRSPLPPQEACRPGTQGKEACLGTQLTPHEAVTSLTSSGKPVFPWPLSPNLWAWPSPGQGQSMGTHPAACWVLAQRQASHLPGFILPPLPPKLKTSWHRPTPTPSPAQPVSVPVFLTILTPECVPVQFVLHLHHTHPGPGAFSTPGSQPPLHSEGLFLKH